MLGLKMCVLPRGTLIQAWLTQFQVRVPMPPKKLPKMAENGLFWPFLALKPILNLVESHKILHAHVVDPNQVVCNKYWNFENFKVPKFEKKQFFSAYRSRKMISLPPLMLTDLDKIFIGGTSHHGLPPCKTSSNFKCPKFCLKIKNWKKMTPKIVFELVALSY